MTITPETLRLSDQAKAALIRISDQHLNSLVAAWVGVWDELGPEFETAILELALVATDGSISRGALARSRRLATTLELATQRLEELANMIGETVGPDLAAIAEDGRASQIAMIQSQLPAGQISIVTDRLNPRSIDAMVNRTLERIHKDSRPLPADVVRLMKSELIRGIALGDNPRKTAQRIVRRSERRFNGGLTRAMTIARTEVLDMHRVGSQIADKDNTDILEGWRWHAALSARTCPSCLANHGTMHPASEPGPVDHHQGRCARLPQTKSWADLGFTGVTEPVDAFPDAREWFDNLTVESQLEIMGKERLALLQSGKIGWEDLTTRTKNGQWRDSMTATPLAALKKHSGG
ncbi:phage minor head protein [Paenarthrobacter nitroguajacolicus]|uniref:phage minor head protein n=1 Tax=Paenarthrobacter nitroguajacolicus TaxID=211146 RepID=UPI003AE43F9F